MSTSRMILTRRLLLAALVLLAPFPRSTGAQEPKPAVADDAAILPFVDEGTFIVVRLDVDRVDQDALAKYMERAIERTLKGLRLPEERFARHKKDAMLGIEPTRNWLTRMAAAGATRLYVLFDQADQQTAGADGPLIVVPLTGGADAEEVKAELTRPGTGGMAVDQAGGAILMGQEPAVERVKKLAAATAKPAARPDLARAFEAAGKDAPLRIAFVPGEATRQWIEQSFPQLPEPLGGGDTKLLSRGVLFAGAAVTQKPATLANVSVRAADPAQAKALLDLLNKGAQYVKKSATGGPMAELFAKEVDAFKPTLEGETVRFSVDPATILPHRVQGEIDAPAGQPGEAVKPTDGL